MWNGLKLAINLSIMLLQNVSTGNILTGNDDKI